ncbi:MAG: 50S ribosomal protein L29 [Candidatus Pacebacteria bacterium]|nr:50S ribosomal protein L29 [Candidatus Paceibacterota bacterium]
MKFKDLKEKNLKELHELLAEKREELRALRFKDSNKQLKNVKEISVTKKDISRILTLINKQKDQVKK